MTHADFNELLRQRFREKSTEYRGVRLPADARIRFGGDTQCMTVCMSETAVRANMQDDAAAFEAWSAILMTWCGVHRITIDWQTPVNTADGHYQRFLYRLRHFEALLGPEVFSIARRERLRSCRIGNGSVPTLNVASGRDTADVPSPDGSEADLEKRFAGANPAERSRLMVGLSLVRLDRQMPVGVFDGTPTRASAIFTGGKSAIDLLGLDTDGAMWLLELKTTRNVKVGALSELFFYSMVLNDARKGEIRFHNGSAGPRSTIGPAAIRAAPRIHARLLAAEAHPLLSRELFDWISASASSREWAVDYGFQNLTPYLGKRTAP